MSDPSETVFDLRDLHLRPRFGPGARTRSGTTSRSSAPRRVLVVTDPGVLATGGPTGWRTSLGPRHRGGGARHRACRADRRKHGGGRHRARADGRSTRSWPSQVVDRHGQGRRPHADQSGRPHGLRQRTDRRRPVAAAPSCSRSSQCRRPRAPVRRARRSACSTSWPSRSRRASAERLRPTLAVVDPRLMLTQPQGVTASAGMDILPRPGELDGAALLGLSAQDPGEGFPLRGQPIADLWSERAMISARPRLPRRRQGRR